RVMEALEQNAVVRHQLPGTLAYLAVLGDRRPGHFPEGLEHGAELAGLSRHHPQDHRPKLRGDALQDVRVPLQQRQVSTDRERHPRGLLISARLAAPRKPDDLWGPLREGTHIVKTSPYPRRDSLTSRAGTPLVARWRRRRGTCGARRSRENTRR